MRVSPIGFAFKDVDVVLAEAKHSAEITHNHPEGVKGAQAVAASVFLARTRESKSGLQKFIEDNFGYNLKCSLDFIRPNYTFDVTCQGTVPAAILCFLESTDFEDAIRNAVSLGGDSDTLACITGAIAEAYYSEIPQSIHQEVMSRLDASLKETIEEFGSAFPWRRTI
jgi:ADP-ribosylglycohydrolase